MKISNEILNEIAENLEMGFSCFLNKETAQLITIPKEIDFLDNEFDHEFGDEFKEWQDDIEIVKNSPDNFFHIESMDSGESFRIMKDFIETVADKELKERLLLAIHVRKPFAHFKSEIDNSGSERERWFEFKKQRFFDWVKHQLEVT